MKIQKKYDWVILLEYALVWAICLFMIIFPIVTRDKFKLGVIDFIFITLSILVLCYFVVNFFSIKYYSDDKHLYIRSGMNKIDLELKKITEVKHKKRYFCSSITATHCLEIVYSPFGSSADLRYFYISIKDEESFINELKTKSKKLKVN